VWSANVRRVFLAAGLTALFVVSHISSGVAASAYHRADTSHSSYSSNASAPVSRAEEPVPSNCIRQSCGKLWCWQMRGAASR
jgi:hypothetical protein